MKTTVVANLFDSNANILRGATLREIINSLRVAPEGHIRVDEGVCYVADVDADDALAKLLDEASSAGDAEQVALCESALSGDEEALAECLDVIADAQAG